MHLVGIACLRWMRGLSRRATHLLLDLEEWAMPDIFAVALLVVVAQVATQASLTPRMGLWCLPASAVGSGADAWLLRSRSDAGSARSG